MKRLVLGLLFVAACNPPIESGGSGELTAPGDVSVEAGDGQAVVTFDDVEGATDYVLYVASEEGATGSRVVGVSSPFTKAGLTNFHTYYFAVAALNENGEGPLSDYVDAVGSPGTELEFAL